MTFRNLGLSSLIVGLVYLWLSHALNLYLGSQEESTIYPSMQTAEWYKGGSVTTSSYSARPVQVAMKHRSSYPHSTRFGAAAPVTSFSTTSAPLLAMNSTSHSSAMIMPTTSSASVHSVTIGGGSTGTAEGGSSHGNTERGIRITSVPVVSMPVITTSASQVGGGMTASQTYARIAGKRMGPDVPGEPDCPYCIDANGDNVCDRCGHNLLDGCTCESESGYCWCPIGDGWQVMIFMMLLSIGYVVWKRGTLRAPLFL